MTRLVETQSKYNSNSSTDELINAIITLQKQIPMTGIEIRSTIGRSSDELSLSINDFKKVIEKFSSVSSESSKALNFWTKVLALSTVVLAFVTIVTIFKS
jgi:hypothetical protein